MFFDRIQLDKDRNTSDRFSLGNNDPVDRHLSHLFDRVDHNNNQQDMIYIDQHVLDL